MLKVIVILILIGYLFYRVTSFIFTGLFKGFNQGDSFMNGGPSRKARNGQVNIHTNPGQSTKSGRSFDGGEYVDYEEVK